MLTMHNQGATHYTLGELGADKIVIHVWQPYGENAADSAVGANIRAALYSLYHSHLERVVVNVSNVGWSRIVADPICEEGAVCPIALLLGTSQLPQTLGKVGQQQNPYPKPVMNSGVPRMDDPSFLGDFP